MSDSALRRTEDMFHVEVYRRRPDGNWEWRVRHVDEVEKGEEIRCKHCKGPVRLAKGDEVEKHARHKDGVDATGCPGSPLGKKGDIHPRKKKT